MKKTLLLSLILFQFSSSHASVFGDVASGLGLTSENLHRAMCSLGVRWRLQTSDEQFDELRAFLDGIRPPGTSFSFKNCSVNGRLHIQVTEGPRDLFVHTSVPQLVRKS